ncbi:hypothetical protein V5799_019039 [Amblyomma americanum]|uniref:Uncharacterized protein n=1 Tax=Amblyomma americanum TaxID=6943 RepID=A0AAQ4EY12_AMBAM
MEWEENSDEDYPCEENWEEDYLFCDDCGIAHPGDCPKHGPLTHVKDAECCGQWHCRQPRNGHAVRKWMTGTRYAPTRPSPRACPSAVLPSKGPSTACSP